MKEIAFNKVNKMFQEAHIVTLQIDCK